MYMSKQDGGEGGGGILFKKYHTIDICTVHTISFFKFFFKLSSFFFVIMMIYIPPSFFPSLPPSSTNTSLQTPLSGGKKKERSHFFFFFFQKLPQPANKNPVPKDNLKAQCSCKADRKFIPLTYFCIVAVGIMFIPLDAANYIIFFLTRWGGGD